MQPMGARGDSAASDNGQQSNQAAASDAAADAVNGDQDELRCAVIGILPPSTELYHHITGTISSIDDAPIQWREEYSTVHDEENSNKLTLLMSVIYTDQTVTPEAIVEAVQTELRTKCCSSTAAAATEDNNNHSSAELWAVSPAPFPLRPLQGYDSLIHIDAEHWQDDAPSTLREYGIVTQSNILDQSEITELKQLVDEAIAEVENKLQEHRPEIDVGEDTFIFREIASRNLQRFDLRLDTIPRAHEMVERCIMCHDTIRKFLADTLGPSDDMDYDVSVLYSRPGAVDQKWHSDGAHQDDTADAGFDENGWKTTLSDPYAVCLFLPLIDLDEESGYTQFWPRSHRHRGLSGFGAAAELAKSTYDGICTAGDAIWYDYRLLHRGRFNISTVVRPVLQVIFKKKFYIERVNYGKESIVRSCSDGS